MNYDLFEGWTSDGPAKVPGLTEAPTDPEAAAPGDPFVHGISLRTDRKPLVRFWFKDKHYPEELRVDFETLVPDYDGTPATIRATAQLISVVFFYYHVNGFFKDEGVKRLHLRNIRTGERLAGPHP